MKMGECPHGVHPVAGLLEGPQHRVEDDFSVLAGLWGWMPFPAWTPHLPSARSGHHVL